MVIYGNEIEVKVGCCIRPDGWSFGGRLISSAWDKAQFRLPRPAAFSGDPIQSLAVNVVVTGRTVQLREGGYWVRVRIEFVGDGEPSTFTGGWLLRE
jgi:hypothetical protein